MSSSSTGGAPGAPGASPVGPDPGRDATREKLREARRRADRIYGIGLLIVGVFATIINMTVFTENSLAQQFATMSEQYGIDDYTRPAGLGAVSLAGIIGHPVIYAIALYVAVVMWKRGRIISWIPIVGAVVAFVFSAALMAVALSMHPELLQAASTGTPTPTPSP